MAEVFTKTIKGKLKLHWHEAILTILTISYFSYFTIASFLRYDNYHAGRFDLGNMAQTVWNTIHGRVFLLTDPNGTAEISRLAFHADFILILLSPLYLIWEDPRMLLLVQTLVLSSGGIFVYLMGKHVLRDKTLSLVLALSFFLNPAVNYTNLFDFHPVTLATTFLLAAFYFILKKRYALTIIFLALAGLTKEQVWLIIALLGLYLVFIHKQKFLGISIFAISSIIFYLLIWIAIPKALGSEHFAISYYSDFGGSPNLIIKNIALSPAKTFQTIFLPDRVEYLKQLFLPLGYLSFFAPFYLIFAFPDLVINLLSSNSVLHQIYYQYSASVTPFIFISTIFAISKLRTKLPEISSYTISTILLVFTFVSAYNFGPLLYTKKPNTDIFVSPLPVRKTVDEYIKALPEIEKVSATNNLGSHLSHRRYIYTIPIGIEEADRVMFLVKEESTQKEKDTLKKLLNDPKYVLVFNEGSFYVFKKASY